ncbi:Heart- and neural crest derivatives-expressed protein 2-like protein [Leptotrombidium deliense]|uniref:Heart-and neural crest derivatives-expressed protein 2-like protein n=1 Tax=Leptotrombidium deliense TaxID=299467 RepID=A0A443S986_9ACAR|nr:Heart- and neural crest derivatives-expressed protein 2-like protein [Leptotrombidium deliense]
MFKRELGGLPSFDVLMNTTAPMNRIPNEHINYNGITIKQDPQELPMQDLQFASPLNEYAQQEPLDYSNLLDDSIYDTHYGDSPRNSTSPELCDEDSSEPIKKRFKQENGDMVMCKEDSSQINDDLHPMQDDSSLISTSRMRLWKKYSRNKEMSKAEIEKKRNLANTQERQRMRKLNNALELLRKAIPEEFHMNHPPRRLSKIKTLRKAIEYIRHLEVLLSEPDCNADIRALYSLTGNDL